MNGLLIHPRAFTNLTNHSNQLQQYAYECAIAAGSTQHRFASDCATAASLRSGWRMKLYDIVSGGHMAVTRQVVIPILAPFPSKSGSFELRAGQPAVAECSPPRPQRSAWRPFGLVGERESCFN